MGVLSMMLPRLITNEKRLVRSQQQTVAAKLIIFAIFLLS